MNREIKSFVLRKGRMTEGQKKAFSELASEYVIDSDNGLNFVNSLARDTQIIMEIGFGMGDATWQIARDNPDKFYIAVEVYPPGVGRLLSKIRDCGLKNIRIFRNDAVDILQNCIPDAILEGIHIFFPDPWPKKRHNKRRLLKTPFVSLLTGKLTKNGYLYVVTDWKDYAEEILDNLSSEKQLVNKYERYAEPREWRPSTSFEMKGRKKEHDIYEFYFLKC